MTVTFAVMPGLTSDVGLSRENVTPYVTTLLDTVEVESISVTWAETSSLGNAEKLTVAGWLSATRATSVSLKDAFTCSWERLINVMKPDPLLEELLAPVPDDPLPPVPPPPPPEELLVDELELEEDDDDTPPPLTV